MIGHTHLLLVISLFLISATDPNIKEYESLAHIDVARYAKTNYRTFDKDGVILQDGKYHPLTICFYGIMNYDEFIKTGDSLFYARCLNQYKYFVDSNFVSADSNTSIGLIYRWNAFDLKPPWISGMTQGAAVSYLLRYYKLTSDTNALHLCPSFIRLMLKPAERGGSLGRTKEGLPWIEEYPNSKRHKSVMNGFINGFVGLYEYCETFPEDSLAELMRDSCYDALLNSVAYYDRPNWTMYSRGSWDVSNAYMRYQIQEFEHLFSLYHDERLRNQMRIWSYFAVSRPDTESTFLKNPDYHFACFMRRFPLTDSVAFSEYETFTTGLQNVFPSSVDDHTMSFVCEDPKYYAELTGLAENISLNLLGVATYRGDTVAVISTYRNHKFIFESDNPFDQLKICFPNTILTNQLHISLKLYSYKQSQLSLFGFCPTKKIESLKKGEIYCFSWRGTNLTNATVLYRFAPTQSDLKSQCFRNSQAFKLNGGTFVAPENGVYEFILSYDLLHPSSSLTVWELKCLTGQ